LFNFNLFIFIYQKWRKKFLYIVLIITILWCNQPHSHKHTNKHPSKDCDMYIVPYIIYSCVLYVCTVIYDYMMYCCTNCYSCVLMWHDYQDGMFLSIMNLEEVMIVLSMYSFKSLLQMASYISMVLIFDFFSKIF